MYVIVISYKLKKVSKNASINHIFVFFLSYRSFYSLLLFFIRFSLSIQNQTTLLCCTNLVQIINHTLRYVSCGIENYLVGTERAHNNIMMTTCIFCDSFNSCDGNVALLCFFVLLLVADKIE